MLANGLDGLGTPHPMLQHSMNEAERVRHLAGGYRVSGAPVGELCAHNATVAAAVGEAQLAQAWEALHFVLSAMIPEVPIGSGCESASAAATAAAAAAAAAAEGAAATPRANGSAASVAGVGMDGSSHGNNGPVGMVVATAPTDDAEYERARQTLLECVAPMVASMLEHHAERGDAQTCVILARTLQQALPELASPSVVQRWTLGYVEQLHRLQLFSLANEVIKHSEDERVSQLSQRSTTVNVGGGGSSASLGKPPRATCSVCHLPVRGLYVWCQGCGHGGHADHLRQWFEGALECPTGCGHICQLRESSVSWPARV